MSHRRPSSPDSRSDQTANEAAPDAIRQLTEQNARLLAEVEQLRQAQQALRASRELFAALFRKAPVAYCTLNMSGEIREANEAMTRLLDCHNSALVGRPFIELVLAEDRPLYVAFNLDLVRGATSQACDLRMLDAGRPPLWIRLSAVAVQDDGVESCRGLMLSEIPEHSSVRRAPGETTIIGRAAMDSLPEHIAVLDPEGKVLAVNTAWQKFALDPGGTDSATNPVGQSYFAVCERALDTEDADQAAQLSAGIRSVLAGSVPAFAMEYACRVAGAEFYYLATVVALSGPERGAVVTHRDISALHSLQREASKRDGLFALCFENMMDACVVHGEGAVILDVNRQTCASLGYAREELIGKTPAVFDPDFAQFPVEEAKTRLALGELVCFRARHRRKDGSEFPVEVRICELLAKDQNRYRVSVSRDISDRMRAEELQQRLQKIADRLPGVVYQLRLHTDGRYSFPYASDGMYAVFGVTAEAVCRDATEVFARVHPEDLDTVQNSALDSARDLTPWCSEFRVQHEDGSERWLSANALPEREAGGSTLWHGFITDITEQRRREEEARQHEGLFRLCWEHAADGIMLHGLGGVILDVNPRNCERLGYTREELIGKSPAIFDPQGMPEDTAKVEAELEAGIVHQFETRFQRKDGTDFPVEVRVSGFMEAGFVHGVSLSRDISFRKQAEEVQNRLKKIADRLPGVIYQYRMYPDGRHSIPYMSDGSLAIYGVSAADAMANADAISATIHPDDHEKVFAAVAVSSRDLTPWRCEFRIRRTDGVERWLFGDGLPEREADGSTLWHGFITDVTERKRADAALQYSEQRLSELINAIDGIVWEAELPTFQTTFVSRQAERILEYPVHCWTDEPDFWQGRIHPDDRDRIVNACLSESLAGRGQRLQYRMLAADGRVVWVDDLITVTLTGGHPHRVLGIIVDITARIEAEAEREEARQRLQHIANHVPGTVYQFRLRPDGTLYFPYVSERLSQLLGVRPEALRDDASPLLALLEPDDRDKIVADIRAAGPERGFHQQREFRARFPDGTLHWIASNSLREREADGSTSWYGFMTDITARRAMETALQMRERDLRTIVNNLPGAVSRVDRTLHYVFVSDSYEQLFGRPCDQIVGLAVEDLIGPEVFSRAQNYLLRALEGVRVTFENHMITAAGETLFTLVHLVPYLDEQNKPDGFFIVLVDVTELKLTEAARAEASNRLSKIASRIPGVVYQFRLRPDGSMCFPYASDGLREIFGVEPEAVRNDADMVFRRLHPEDNAGILMSIQQSAGTLSPWSHEFRLLSPDGTVRWVAGNSVPEAQTDGSILWHGYLFDISERKAIEVALQTRTAELTAANASLQAEIAERIRTEQALGESESRFRHMADTAPIMILTVNSERSRMYINRQAQDFLGQSMAEIPCVEWASAIHSDDQERCKQAFYTAFDQRVEIEQEYRVRNAHGDYRWIVERSGPRFTSGGEFVGYMSVCGDITERREAERLRLDREIAQRSVLVREVHHRIKNHLQGLIGLLERLEQKCPAALPLFQEAAAQTQAIATIHGLQARMEAKQLGLTEVVTAIVVAMRNLTPTPIALRVIDPNTEWFIIESCSVGVALAINELLLNAVKHGCFNSTYRGVDVTLCGAAQEFEIRVRNPGQLSSSQTGTTLATPSGTGLGLARLLLPLTGADLELAQSGSLVEATLRLSPPTIVAVASIPDPQDPAYG